MPLFNELEKRNPTPELSQQIPLLKGIWFPVLGLRTLFKTFCQGECSTSRTKSLMTTVTMPI